MIQIVVEVYRILGRFSFTFESSCSECRQKGINATESKFSFYYLTPQRCQQRTRPAKSLASRP
jgi:hypothetical protein